MNTTNSPLSIKNKDKNAIKNENIIRAVTQNSILKVVHRISTYQDTIGCITIIKE